MIAIRTMLRSVLADRKGATAIEYGLIVALIAVAAMGAIATVGNGTDGMWAGIRDKVLTT